MLTDRIRPRRNYDVRALLLPTIVRRRNDVRSILLYHWANNKTWRIPSCNVCSKKLRITQWVCINACNRQTINRKLERKMLKPNVLNDNEYIYRIHPPPHRRVVWPVRQKIIVWLATLGKWKTPKWPKYGGTSHETKLNFFIIILLLLSSAAGRNTMTMTAVVGRVLL